MPTTRWMSPSGSTLRRRQHLGSQPRIVATISDAGDTCTEEETHARVNTKYVQDWINDTIAAR
jgi:hypothetical protein